MTIYALGADAKTTHLELAQFEMFDWSMYLAEGDYLPTSVVRSRWKPLALRLQGLRRRDAQPQDAYPVGYFAGVALVVSARFRETAERHFRDQCAFLPVQVEGTKVEYFALWANNVLDGILDIAQSDVREGPGKTVSIRQYVIAESAIQGVDIFRLPERFSGVQELVTQKFVDVTRTEGLVGLTFWDRSRKSAVSAE